MLRQSVVVPVSTNGINSVMRTSVVPGNLFLLIGKAFQLVLVAHFDLKKILAISPASAKLHIEF